MNSFIETSLRNFCSTHDIFGDSSVYVHFERKSESKENSYGFSSEIIFGHVVFRTQQNEAKISAPLMLKNMKPLLYCPDFTHVQYFNEISFYTRALPFLQQFGGNVEIILPKFYDSFIHCSQSTTKIVLIYENLKAQGFRDCERFSFLDLDHLTLMFCRLGQFHSYSYMAKSRNPQAFSALGQWFKYPLYEFIRGRSNYFRLFAQNGVQRLRQDPRYRGHIAKIENLLQNTETIMLQLNTMEQEEPMSVLCHGDYLRGNVIFRYENGQPVDMKIIDMATCRIGSPVIDLSLVLYLNADQQMRSRHWNHLVDAYYEGLCQVFGGIGVPSKENILKEFTTKAVYGYVIASIFLPSLIDMDRAGIISNFTDYVPTEFVGRPHTEIPDSVFQDSINKWCNEEDIRSEALADILRDLIDRHFI